MLYMRMLKANAATRIVQARLDETPDRAKMVMDYATSRPEFERWSEAMRKASGGKSLGNVRAMHQLEAVGKVEAIDFDDATRSIDLMIKIVDDDAWLKIEEGVYTGISPGGNYRKRWSDGAFTRYTAGPDEISLVDVPCKPEATFTMVKADGAEETRSLKGADEIEQLTEALLAASSPGDYRAIVLAQPAEMVKALFPDEAMQKVAAAQGLQKRQYSGDEREAMASKGHALPDGSYPIDDKKDLKDAIDAYGRAKDKAAAKALIEKRARDLGATDLLPADWDGSTKKKMAKAVSIGDLRKGLGDVSQLASLLNQLTWLASCVAVEAGAERDGSATPGRLVQWLADGASILAEMTSEETREAVTALQASVAAIPETMRKAVAAAEMAKAGARHSKADMDRVQAIHDHASALGAACGDGMAKGMGSSARIAFELATTRERLAKVEGDNAEMKKRLAEPAGGGPRLRAVPVDRSADTGRGAVDAGRSAELAEILKLPSGPDKAAKMIRFEMENPQPPSIPAAR